MKQKIQVYILVEISLGIRLFRSFNSREKIRYSVTQRKMFQPQNHVAPHKLGWTAGHCSSNHEDSQGLHHRTCHLFGKNKTIRRMVSCHD
jgi:hypothetical protein